MRKSIAASALVIALLGSGAAIGASKSGFGTPVFGPSAQHATVTIGTAYEAVVAKAKKTLDVTNFEVTRPDVVSALIAAGARGVTVRVITDSSYTANAPFVKQLKAATNVSVVERAGSNSTGIMHAKYTVIDGKAVWTGSGNFSGGGTISNAENAALLTSSALVADFESDFKQMWAGKWGNGKTAAPPHASVAIPDGKGGKTSVDVFISGQQGPKEYAALVNFVASAKSTLHIYAYVFDTANATQPLIDAIVAAAKRGVVVKAMFDDSSSLEQHENASTISQLTAAGVSVIQWHPSFGLLHDKVMIVDGKSVEFGSFNYTSLAAGLMAGEPGNDDYFLIVHDNADFGAAYDADFEAKWKGAGGH
jgi:phosphatidylserine/phosphatidylglycerophosphate/cardiolipin synthase-like enzyme